MKHNTVLRASTAKVAAALSRFPRICIVENDNALRPAVRRFSDTSGSATYFAVWLSFSAISMICSLFRIVSILPNLKYAAHFYAHTIHRKILIPNRIYAYGPQHHVFMFHRRTAYSERSDARRDPLAFTKCQRDADREHRQASKSRAYLSACFASER